MRITLMAAGIAALAGPGLAEGCLTQADLAGGIRLSKAGAEVTKEVRAENGGVRSTLRFGLDVLEVVVEDAGVHPLAISLETRTTDGVTAPPATRMFMGDMSALARLALEPHAESDLVFQPGDGTGHMQHMSWDLTNRDRIQLGACSYVVVHVTRVTREEGKPDLTEELVFVPDLMAVIAGARAPEGLTDGLVFDTVEAIR